MFKFRDRVGPLVAQIEVTWLDFNHIYKCKSYFKSHSPFLGYGMWEITFSKFSKLEWVQEWVTAGPRVGSPAKQPNKS